MSKLWIEDTMYIVDDEVDEYVSMLEEKIERMKFICSRLADIVETEAPIYKAHIKEARDAIGHIGEPTEMVQINKELFHAIALEVQEEWKMSGLSDTIAEEYAEEIANRYITNEKYKNTIMVLRNEDSKTKKKNKGD